MNTDAWQVGFLCEENRENVENRGRFQFERTTKQNKAKVIRARSENRLSATATLIEFSSFFDYL